MSGRLQRTRGTLVVLGAILIFVSIWAIWAERQGLRTDRFTETSDELIQREVVRSALATYAVDQLYEEVDVQRELRRLLPDEADRAAGPAAAGLRGLAETAAQEVMGTDQFQDLWRQANRAAHDQFRNIVFEEEGVVTAEGERAVLNLRPLVVALAEEIGLGQGVAREIPRDVAEIEVLRAEEIGTAQDTARALDGVALGSSLVALALFALALFLDRRNAWATAAWIGVGMVIAGIAALISREIAGDLIVDELAEPGFESAGEAVWEVGTSLQTSIAWIALAYGAGFLVAGWLGSPTEGARSTRRVMAPVLRDRFVLVIAVLLVAAALWTLAGADSDRAVFTRLGLAVLALVGLVALRRQTAREFPRVTGEQVTSGARDAAGDVGKSLQEGLAKARETADTVIDTVADGAQRARGDGRRRRKRSTSGRKRSTSGRKGSSSGRKGSSSGRKGSSSGRKGSSSGRKSSSSGRKSSSSKRKR